jgi:hypothetical protein
MRDETVDSAFWVAPRKHFVAMLLTLVAAQTALYIGIGQIFFVVALTLGGLYLLSRTYEALWVCFILLAVTSQVYQVRLDEKGVSVEGSLRPYILVVTVVGISILLGPLFVARKTHGRQLAQHRRFWNGTLAFVTVMFIALVYGFFRASAVPGIVDMVRQCSGWMTLVVFIILGYWIAPTPKEIRGTISKLTPSVLAYSTFFLGKFAYLTLSDSADQSAVQFGYSQRDMTFYAGVIMAVIAMNAIRPATRINWKKGSVFGLVLLSAILASGSRSIFLSVLIVALLTLVVTHPKLRPRLALLGIVLTVLVLLGPSLDFLNQQASGSSISSYISSRFLSASSQDSSLLARASEMIAVGQAIRDNPLLGWGPLATYSFFDPYYGWIDTTFVDNGLGYILMKSGFLGLIAFIWFAVGWCRSLRDHEWLYVAIFAYYLAFLPFGPSFFIFQYSWFIGLLLGYTIRLDSESPALGGLTTRFGSIRPRPA